MNRQFRGSLCLLGGTFIWGTAFVAQSVGMENLGPFTFQAVRCVLAVISLIIAIRLFDNRSGSSFFAGWKSKHLWKTGLLCGLALFAAASLQQIGLVYTDAGKAGFITAMYIVLVPILGLFFHKKPPVSAIVSVVIAVIGLYLLSCAGVTGINIGDVLLLGCALAFAVQITLIDKFAGDLDPLRLNCIQCLVCAAVSWVVVPFAESFTWQAVASAWLPLGYAGVLSMGVAYSLQIVGQKNLEPTTASLIMSLESVVAAAAGGLILNERMNIWEIMGCAMVFGAVILSQLPTKHKSMAPS